MSMHKVPLNKLEEEGLKLHGLSVGKPSQLSDVFRQGVAWALSQQDGNEVASPAQDERGAEVPPMPETADRRPYDDDEPDGYLEGNRDWAEANNDAVEWLADNHRAIRAALSARPAQKVNNVDTPEQQPIYQVRQYSQGWQDVDHARYVACQDDLCYYTRVVYAAPIAAAGVGQ